VYEGFAGCKLWAPRVLLVGTQANLASKDAASGVESDPEVLLDEMQQRYDVDLIIEPHFFVVDSSTTTSTEMTMLKRAMATVKQFICEVCTFSD